MAKPPQLRKLYDFPSDRAIHKVLNTLDKHCINFINHSPFLTLATISKGSNIDASSRGGKAQVSTDRNYLAIFKAEKHPPKTCIIFTVNEAFLHCAKALMCSKLWSVNSQIKRTTLPTMGEMLKDQLRTDKKAEMQEAMIKRYYLDI